MISFQLNLFYAGMFMFHVEHSPDIWPDLDYVPRVSS